ncbi:MAG: hypothetical protein NTV34_15700 [Proteobacteria bacterium]|nr:hypothetical protein [Pseudomonadota bacterium]
MRNLQINLFLAPYADQTHGTQRRACQHFGTILLVLVLFALSWSEPSAAFIDAQAELGTRSATWAQDGTSSKVSAQVLRASAHLDPIPLVPVSFGLGAYSETWKVNETDQGLTSLQSYSLTPEVLAWLPLGDFRPFGRIGYSLLSAYSGKASIQVGATKNTGTMALVGNGVHLAAGLEWNVPMVPLLSIIGSVEYASERVRLAKDKVGDVDISSVYKPINLTSTALLVGAKVGF